MKNCFRKRTFCIFLSLMLMLSATFAVALQDGKGKTVTAYASLTPKEQPKMALTYSAPAKDWETQALPLGNGFIGGMVFGGVVSDKIQINEHTLWSGGPGADESYNGGNEVSKTNTIKSNLQAARNSLQAKMIDFTNNKSAYISGGKVVANNYGGEDAALQANIRAQMGSKNNFGDYQTLGNILIEEKDYAKPVVVSVKSNANPSNVNEQADKLFDGSSGTKWYAGDSYPNPPYVIEWSYNTAYKIDQYKITSANDMEGRDPKKWTLSGSNNGVGYTIIDVRDDQSFSERQQTKTYSLSQEATYQYYKLEITALRTSGYVCQMAEIELLNSAADQVSYSNYKRTLDLDNAAVSVNYTQDSVDYTREYFINNPQNVMAIKLSASQKGKLNKRISLTSEQTSKTIQSSGSTITMTGQPSDHGENGLKFAQMLRVVNTGGTISAANGYLEVSGADSVVIYMSAGTNYVQCMDDSFNYFSAADPLTKVNTRVTQAVVLGYDVIKSEHRDDYKELFDRAKINLGTTAVPSKNTDQLLSGYHKTNSAYEDRYFETLYYQFGRYLLISSSRPGSLPANLQGIWAQGLTNPWSSDYHTNINLQMNYWLAEQTNLAECHEPLIDYINSLVPRGQITAKTYYEKQNGGDVRGWATNHENNIWGHTAPSDYYGAFYFPAAAAWLCQDIYEVYKFNGDKAFMEENYDTMMQAALFWVDNLWVDSRDNTLVANPSYSPEHGSYSIGASSDQEIIYELFREVIEISEDLGKTSSELEEIKTAMAKLYMPKIGLFGGLLEWKDELAIEQNGDGQHRHANHLFLLHPGSQVVVGRSAEDDQMVSAIQKVLEIRGDGGTGWSKAWKINFWARLRDGEHAMTLIRELFKESTLTNLFDTHPPFQIDGNFGATAGMNEMLIQSQGDIIALLPAIPVDWNTESGGSFSGLKARGNFEVSMNWQKDKNSEIEILSNNGNDCTLKYADLSKATVIDLETNKAVSKVVDGNDQITFKTVAGRRYAITQGEAPCDLIVSKVAVNPANLNFGDSASLVATVRNSSDVDVTEPINVTFIYNNKIVEELTYTKGIEADGYVNVVSTKKISPMFGSQSGGAKIETAHPETNDKNNYLKFRFIVTDE